MAARRITVLTGAGISAESGLGTFRDKDGLWTKYPLEEVATPEGFARDPARVHAFYNARRANAAGAQPNAAHLALARLQRAEGIDLVIVTQNVDGLHEAAGATAVHMHGELSRAYCGACEHRWDAPAVMSPEMPCPACGAPATRPDIVWFGEIPYHMDAIHQRLSQTELFAAIGTSGQVYPAAGFVQIARQYGAETVEINLEQTDVAWDFDDHLVGPASQMVPAWVASLIGEDPGR
ncbi:NAD-dependent deacylase [Mesobacterium pallidum]|uniref:NAD-dependent deacylase n=1 Tax=Mesobacterium pallidum TaxID=2872037 RepID=UPI001EE219B5|nr:NAD-dependent deacylase [Mesobacterium pallidum]